MIEDRDRELREGFGAVRREAAARAPDFHEIVAGLAGRRARLAQARRRLATLAVAAAVAVLVLLGPGRSGGPSSRRGVVDLAVTRWQAPTDFLLRTPGVELLRAGPALTTEGSLP